jgi:hypothetical protein
LPPEVILNVRTPPNIIFNDFIAIIHPISHIRVPINGLYDALNAISRKFAKRVMKTILAGDDPTPLIKSMAKRNTIAFEATVITQPFTYMKSFDANLRVAVEVTGSYVIDAIVGLHGKEIEVCVKRIRKEPISEHITVAYADTLPLDNKEASRVAEVLSERYCGFMGRLILRSKASHTSRTS